MMTLHGDLTDLIKVMREESPNAERLSRRLQDWRQIRQIAVRDAFTGLIRRAGMKTRTVTFYTGKRRKMSTILQGN